MNVWGYTEIFPITPQNKLYCFSEKNFLGLGALEWQIQEKWFIELKITGILLNCI